METPVGVQCIGCGKPASAIIECGYCGQTQQVVGWHIDAERDLPAGKVIKIGVYDMTVDLLEPIEYTAKELVSALRCGHCGNPLSHVVCCLHCDHGWLNNWDFSNADIAIAHIGKFEVNHWTWKPLMAMM